MPREISAFATGVPNLPRKGQRVRLAPFVVYESLAGMQMKMGLHEAAEGIVRHCYGVWPKDAKLSPGGSRPEGDPYAVELHIEDASRKVLSHYRPYTPAGIGSIYLVFDDPESGPASASAEEPSATPDSPVTPPGAP